MAESTSSVSVEPPPESRVVRRRRISPQAGRALEILGHAIDYLIDEYVHQGGTFCAGDPQVHAVQLLMALNRQIYFECPEVPTLKERCRAFLHLRAAQAISKK
jgi:hypothetical protein